MTRAQGHLSHARLAGKKLRKYSRRDAEEEGDEDLIPFWSQRLCESYFFESYLRDLGVLCERSSSRNPFVSCNSTSIGR